jgi:8-oxo-dGTP diphosphatase
VPISDYLRRLRRRVGNELLLMPSVTVINHDEQERVLLVRDAEAGTWVLPGGSIDPHERPAEAAVREMQEETGLLVEPLRVQGVYGGPAFHVTYANRDEVSYTMVAFECRVAGGEMRPDGVETRDLAYFARANLSTPEVPPWVRTVLAGGSGRGTHFRAPTWVPPADGRPQGGMPDYVRRLRRRIGNEQLIIPAAAGMIRDGQGRVLLQRRADDGSWTPPGGLVEPHEPPADTVVREVWEETGLLVEPVRVTGVYGGPDFYVTYANGDRLAVVSIVFACQIVGGQARTDGLETAAVDFFAPEALAGDFLPRRWRRRTAHALASGAWAHFDPPA